jgi:hypothetical protein
MSADLGDQVLGGPLADAGDGREPGDLPLIRLAQLAYPGGELVDLGSVLIDAGEHHRQQPGVVTGEEAAVQGLPQPGDLRPRPVAGELGQGPGSRSPPMMASIMARPDLPWMSASTDDSFR